MGFDRNTITGFVLLAVLFMGYFWYVSSNQKEAAAIQKHQQDSLAALRPKVDSARFRIDSLRLAQTRDSISAGDLSQAASGNETFTYIENNLVLITFSNKGGWIKRVELKEYKGPDSSTVKMGDSPEDEFAYNLNTSNNQSTSSSKLYFNPAVVTKAPNGIQTISYQVVGNGKTITHSFVVKPGDYMVDASVQLQGADQLLSQQAMNLHWRTQAHRQQSDVIYEKTQTRLVYRTGDEYDYNSAISGVNKQLEKPTQWIGIKQQFFNMLTRC